jgi:hypothetical protein
MIRSTREKVNLLILDLEASSEDHPVIQLDTSASSQNSLGWKVTYRFRFIVVSLIISAYLMQQCKKVGLVLFAFNVDLF